MVFVKPRFAIASSKVFVHIKQITKPAHKKITYYEKYRCRTCSRYLNRDETHDSFNELLDGIILPEPELKKLKTKLVATFNAKHREAKHEIARLEAISESVQQKITNQVIALTDPSNAFIAYEIRNAIESHRAELAENQEKINALSDEHQSDLAEFLEFAFGFLNDIGNQYFNLPVARRNECTQMLFTGKIYVTENKKCTPKI